MIRTRRLATLLLILAPELLAAQEPKPLPAPQPTSPGPAASLPAVKPPAELPVPQPKTADLPAVFATARLAAALPMEKTIRTGSATWNCRGETCTSSDLPANRLDLRACRELRPHAGPIRGFLRGPRSLTAGELYRCNQAGLERPAGESVVKAGPERLADDVAAGAAPRPFQPSPVDPEFVDRSACEDPSAVEISARLVSHRDHQAEIDIIGVVRNVGRAAYQSQPGQEHRQALTLVETRREPTGSWSYRESSSEVRRQWFANLDPGEEVRLVHRIVWNSAPRETRTVVGSIYHPPLPPHRYRLEVEYAAANATDTNPNNDDCGRVNNEAVLEPSEIQAVVF